MYLLYMQLINFFQNFFHLAEKWGFLSAFLLKY